MQEICDDSSSNETSGACHENRIIRADNEAVLVALVHMLAADERENGCALVELRSTAAQGAAELRCIGE